MGLTKIRIYMNRAGLTSEQLSVLSGVPKSTIDKIAGGFTDNPKYETVFALAKALNCKVDDFSDNYDDKIQETANLFSFDNVIPLPKTKKVPLLGDIACGEPILAAENYDEYINVDEDINCDFAVRCKGDSMIGARILDGDIVYIRQQPTVDNGEIAAVLIDDEVTLKRVYRQPGRVTLVAENPMVKDFVYIGDQAANMRILGKAVIFKSRVR